MRASPLRMLGQSVVVVGVIASVAATLHSVINLRNLRTPSDQPVPCDRKISVLIPARNEAASIGPCITAVRKQAVSELEILVYDDRSTDGTERVVNHHTEDSRVKLVKGAQEPPPGWLGKNWACHQLANHATGSVLAFVDADVTLQPHCLTASVALMAEPVITSQGTMKVSAVCPYPKQIAETVAERLVQPLLQWSWLTFLPLSAAASSPRRTLTAANGQLLVIERDAYDAIGGHEAVRSEVLEDVALFRRLKQFGRRGVMADGTSLASCRMYNGWADLRDGYTKSLWSAFGSPMGAVGVTTVMGALYVVPAVAMLRGSKLALVGYLAAVGGRAVVAARTDGRVLPDSLAHPMSIAAFGYLTARSLRHKARGTLTWKERAI